MTSVEGLSGVTRLRSASWGAARAATALAACTGGPVSCSPCPPAVYVNLHSARTGTADPGKIAEDLGEVRICFAGFDCVEVQAGHGSLSVPLPQGTRADAVDGRTISLTLSPNDPDASRTATGTLQFHPDLGGLCECAYSTAELTVPG